MGLPAEIGFPFTNSDKITTLLSEGEGLKDFSIPRYFFLMTSGQMYLNLSFPYFVTRLELTACVLLHIQIRTFLAILPY